MAVEIRLPLEHPNDVEAEIVRWLVEDGEWIDAGEDLLEVESTKAVMTIVTEAGGFVRRHVAVGDTLTTGAMLARVHATRGELDADPVHPRPAVPSVPVPAAPEPGVAGPAVPAQAVRGPDEGELGVRFSSGGRRELAALGLGADLFAGRGLVAVHHILFDATSALIFTEELARVPREITGEISLRDRRVVPAGDRRRGDGGVHRPARAAVCGAGQRIGEAAPVRRERDTATDLADPGRLRPAGDLAAHPRRAAGAGADRRDR